MQKQLRPAGRDFRESDTCSIDYSDVRVTHSLRFEHFSLRRKQTTVESSPPPSRTASAATPFAHGGSICKYATPE